MGTKAEPGPFDGYAKALPGEPLFTLLARDVRAPTLLRLWATLTKQDIDSGMRPQSDLAMVEEARVAAHEMERWRAENDGVWHVDPDLRNLLQRQDGGR